MFKECGKNGELSKQRLTEKCFNNHSRRRASSGHQEENYNQQKTKKIPLRFDYQHLHRRVNTFK